MSESASEQPTDTSANETDASQQSSTGVRKSLVDLPPEFSWVADELNRARSEAAKYRTRAREFADDEAYDAAKSAMADLEKYRTQVSEMETSQTETKQRAEKAQADLARERAARKHGLSDEALEFLTGDTEEEIEERAKRLSGMTSRKPERPVDPTQGSTSTGGKPASTADQFADFVGGRLS